MSDVAAHPDRPRRASRSSARRCSPPPRRRSATWERWAATCCNARAAAISATPASPATSARPAPAVRPSTARTGCWRSSAAAIIASPRILPISPSRWWRSTPRWNCAAPTARNAPVPLRDFHRVPGDTPQIETNLAPGEMIAAIIVPDDAGGATLVLSEGARPRELRIRAGVGRRRDAGRQTARSRMCASRRAASAPGPGTCRRSKRRCVASR